MMISSCSTPRSEKTGSLTHQNQETGSEDGVKSYLDSAKKKKKKKGLRLNK
jgi:hypothetical protein